MKYLKYMTIPAVAFIMAMAPACSSSEDEEPPFVTCPTDVAVESVTLNESAITLTEGETATLTATVSPDNATDKNVAWSTSDATVATVDDAGTITAISAGTATVTATAGGVSATCSVTVNAATHEPQKGDFYYSDGTWSTDVDKTKTVIGIVYWTGNPIADDPVAAAAHPECTHGLVVSIEQDVVAWQSNQEGYGNNKSISEWVRANAPQYAAPESTDAIDAPIQKIVGYNNTKALEAFNADPANAQWPIEVIAYTVDYRSAVPAPAGTTDWYLPSPKEWSLLCAGEIEGNIVIKDPVLTNLQFINSRIDIIAAAPISKNFFWTSTEGLTNTEGVIANRPDASECAWNYYCNDDEYSNYPLSLSYKTHDTMGRVRCVLAF